MSDHGLRGLAPRLGVAAGVLALPAFVDLGFFNLRSTSGQLLLAEAALLICGLWLVDRQARVGRTLPAAGIGLLAAAVSVLVTRFVADTVPQRQPGLVGLLCLLLIVSVLCRRMPTRFLVCALPPLVAAVYVEQRVPGQVSSMLIGDLWFPLVLLGFLFAGAGFVLRAEDGRRAAVLERVREDERLELARDLHDDVAHYVTGMIVLAQAGEQLAERDPAQARKLFGDLERSGQEGLAAMSRMVRLLRATGPAAPQSALTTVREQVDRFPGAQLHLGPGVDERGWSPDLAKSVQRLVQEGLTNVRKHARATTTVQVGIEQEGDRLVVRVCNDGARGGRVRFRPSGFGIVGLAERVSVLGGELASGPLDGGGWQLTASLPGAR